MAKLEIKPEETICCNDKLLQKTTGCLPSSESWQPFFMSQTPDRALCTPCRLKSVCHCYFLPHFPSFDSFREFNVRINQASFSWLFRLDPNLRNHVVVLQILLTLLIVVQLGDTNSCWRPFPLSFVVTWLCQSECLMSGECELLAACEPHFVQ